MPGDGCGTDSLEPIAPDEVNGPASFASVCYEHGEPVGYNNDTCPWCDACSQCANDAARMHYNSVLREERFRNEAERHREEIRCLNSKIHELKSRVHRR